jgi:hypothetical protein
LASAPAPGFEFDFSPIDESGEKAKVERKENGRDDRFLEEDIDAMGRKTDRFRRKKHSIKRRLDWRRNVVAAVSLFGGFFRGFGIQRVFAHLPLGKLIIVLHFCN